MTDEPRIVNFLLLAKISDGSIRQVITTEAEQRYIANMLTQTSKNGRINVDTKTVEALDWEQKFEL
jgi:hypothetical protein